MTISFINAILSFVVALGLLFSALGWRHSLRGDWNEPEWYFAMAKVLLAIGIGFRMLFWDVIWGVLSVIDLNYAQMWSAAFGRTNINLLSNIVVGMGVYCSLKARQLILQQDRNINWHWTVAWAYPRATTLVKLVTERRQRK